MKKIVLIAGSVAGGLLLLAGCGSSSGSGSSGDSAGATATVTTTVTETPTTPTTPTIPTSAGSSTSSSAPPRCVLGDLKVTLGPSEGAAGSTFIPLRITNTSTHPCRTRGFGGVSLVDSPRAEPLGAPADRSRKSDVKPVVLQPGKRATATVQQANAENFSQAKCHPIPATGFRVYPPDETHAAYVPHRATACGSPAVHLLTLTPYQAG